MGKKHNKNACEQQAKEYGYGYDGHAWNVLVRIADPGDGVWASVG
jgi:uncharacterized protein YvpB